MPKLKATVIEDTAKLKAKLDAVQKKLGAKDTKALNKNPVARKIKAKLHQSLAREASIKKAEGIISDVAAAKAARESK